MFQDHPNADNDGTHRVLIRVGAPVWIVRDVAAPAKKSRSPKNTSRIEAVVDAACTVWRIRPSVLFSDDWTFDVLRVRQTIALALHRDGVSFVRIGALLNRGGNAVSNMVMRAQDSAEIRDAVARVQAIAGKGGAST